MVARLRENWQLGREAVDAKKATPRVSTAAFAEARDLSEHTVRKLKAFATAYNEEELARLLALRRPNGLPLHWGYVVYLLAAQSAAKARGQDDGKAARREFAELAAQKGWTAPQMYAAIRRKYGQKLRPGQKPTHGRSMLLAKDANTAARQVIDLGWAWCKRLKMLVDEKRRMSKSVRAELLELLAKLPLNVRNAKQGLSETNGSESPSGRRPS